MAVAQLTPKHQKQTITRKSRSLYEESFIRLSKNKIAMGSIVFIVLVFASAFVLAPIITTGDYAKQDLLQNNAVTEWMMFVMPPNAEQYVRLTEDFPMSADHLGRDVWTRTIYGARVSLMVAVVASVVSMVVGVTYGLTSGYFGGKIDSFMMRFVDFLYGFPFLITVILLQTYFKAIARRGGGGPIGDLIVTLNSATGGLFLLFVAIGLINWLAMARITRAQVLSLREKEFVEAAKSVGSKGNRIVWKHILPNIIGPLVVYETLAIPGYIFLEAFLSFIGLGVDPPTPSWGIMISEAAPGIRSYPNQVLVPAMALTLTTLAFNFMGDGLRDAFDPRLKE